MHFHICQTEIDMLMQAIQYAGAILAQARLWVWKAVTATRSIG